MWPAPPCPPGRQQVPPGPARSRGVLGRHKVAARATVSRPARTHGRSAVRAPARSAHPARAPVGAGSALRRPRRGPRRAAAVGASAGREASYRRRPAGRLPFVLELRPRRAAVNGLGTRRRPINAPRRPGPAPPRAPPPRAPRARELGRLALGRAGRGARAGGRAALPLAGLSRAASEPACEGRGPQGRGLGGGAALKEARSAQARGGVGRGARPARVAGGGEHAPREAGGLPTLPGACGSAEDTLDHRLPGWGGACKQPLRRRPCECGQSARSGSVPGAGAEGGAGRQCAGLGSRVLRARLQRPPSLDSASHSATPHHLRTSGSASGSQLCTGTAKSDPTGSPILGAALPASPGSPPPRRPHFVPPRLSCYYFVSSTAFLYGF